LFIRDRSGRERWISSGMPDGGHALMHALIL
jgi:hypothetical protein